MVSVVPSLEVSRFLPHTMTALFSLPRFTKIKSGSDTLIQYWTYLSAMNGLLVVGFSMNIKYFS